MSPGRPHGECAARREQVICGRRAAPESVLVPTVSKQSKALCAWMREGRTERSADRRSRKRIRKFLDPVTSPRDGADIDDDRRVERRRSGWSVSGNATIDIPKRSPDVVVLKWIAVPALAVPRDGAISSANASLGVDA